MNALTILKRCRGAKKNIERLQQRIRQRREVLGEISAPQADPNGGSRGSGDRDKIGRILADIDELERAVELLKDAEKAEKTAALALLDMVPELEGKVLYEYYVKRWDTPEIARQEKYTASYVRKVKRSAEQVIGMISAERVEKTLPAWYLRERGEEKG